MAATWVEITCNVPSALSDDFAAFLFSLSGNGVTVDNRTVDTFSPEGLDETPTKTVTAYFDSDADVVARVAEITAYLQTHAAECPGYIPEAPLVATIGEEDWANGWKQHFQVTRIGARLVLKPTWEEYAPAPGDIVIELDPGMAFGTGTHPTTRLCLEFLEKIVFSGTSSRFKAPRVLDVGTGSGILAIAAAKCGAGEVIAIDIDERAVAVADDNSALNGVEEAIRLSTTPLHQVPGSYDIVLANILAEELVRLRTELTSRLTPGGNLVLSGILVEREPFVREGFSALPLTLVESRREEEWCCLWYRREI